MQEILIFVTGLTPQVVTETLYYLTQVCTPSRTISEIYLLTTSLGRRKALEDLLDKKKGRFYTFCKEYNINEGSIQFDSNRVIAVLDKNGNPLTDIRTPEENAALADFIMEFIRERASNPDMALHCSVAGGRKTMSLFLGLALQFFGRPQDRLSHVLIWPPELEGNPDFFYPSKEPKIYRLGDREISSQEVKVHLAEIPLLLLREKIPILKERNGFTYSQLVQRVQQDFELLSSPFPLLVDRTGRSLRISEKVILLTPLEIALYIYLVRKRLEAGCSQECRGCKECFVPLVHFLSEGALTELKTLMKELGVRDERSLTLKGWSGAGGVERFYQVRSSINSKIRKGLEGGTWSLFYEISTIKSSKTGDTLYGISLDKRLFSIK